MFSGWGIRTMASADRGYNPIEYHNGTVWPHDTAIVAEGLRRYGYRQQAATRWRSPCLRRPPHSTTGYPRCSPGSRASRAAGPVAYPTPSRPQAWAAGAVLLALRTLLGLDVNDGHLTISGQPVAPIGSTRLSGIPVHGRRETANI